MDKIAMTHRNSRPVPIFLVMAALAALLLPTLAQAGDNVWTSQGPNRGSVLDIAVDPVADLTAFVATRGGVFKTTDGGVVWTLSSNGLGEPLVSSLAIDPAAPLTVYAGTSLGVYKTTDGGMSWALSATGLPAAEIRDLEILSGTTLYAATGSGVYKSTNSGVSWASVNAGLTEPDTRSLSLGPADTVYVATASGIFKTTNAGSSWAAMNSGLTDTDVRSVLVDPMTDTTIYAGTDGGGVFKSTNSASSWSPSNTGLVNTEVRSLAGHSPTGHLIVGTAAGVFESVDDAATWSAINSGLGNLDAQVVVFDVELAPRIWAGTGGGAYNRTVKWTAASPAMGNIRWLAHPAGTINPVYAATSTGVYKSSDLGATYTAANTGIAGTDVRKVSVDPVTPNNVYAATATGISLSSDAAASWIAPTTPPTEANTYHVAVDPSAPATLWAATTEGIFRSTDSGDTWADESTGLPAPGMDVATVTHIVVDPTDSTKVFAATDSGIFLWDNANTEWDPATVQPTATATTLTYVAGGTPKLLASTPDGIFQSTDSGVNWSASSLAGVDVRQVTVDTSFAGRFLAGTGTGVHISYDSGTTWSQITPGLGTPVVRSVAADPTSADIFLAGAITGAFRHARTDAAFLERNGGLTTGNVRSLYIDLNGADNVFAGTESGIFESTDGGATWSPRNNGLTSLDVQVVTGQPTPAARAPVALYAGTTFAGVFKSTDSGANWVAKSTGLTSTDVRDLALDPVTPTTLYAATGGGVFKTTNGGDAWMSSSTGLTNTNVRAVGVDPNTTTNVYVATAGGVFKSIDSGANWSAINTGLPVTDIRTIAVDPVSSSILYIGTAEAGVFRSIDAGANWVAVSNGLTDALVQAIYIDPTVGGCGASRHPCTVLYIGTGETGVFKSSNGGAVWQPDNNGLGSLTVQALALDPGDRLHLYAGTIGGGAYDIDHGSANLGITKTDGVSVVNPGNSVTYTITVTNPAPTEALTGARVVDNLPAQLQSVTWTCSAVGTGSSCAASGSGNLDESINIGIAGTVTFSVTGTVAPATPAGSLVNVASVSAPAGYLDSNASDNTATDFDNIVPVTDLSITQTAPATGAPGAPISYTLVVANAGPLDAVNATVRDNFPSTVTNFTWSCTPTAGASCVTGQSSQSLTGQTGNINQLVDVPKDGTLTFAISGTIDGEATGSIVNTATATLDLGGGIQDSNTNNNSDQKTTTLAPSVDLQITKTHLGTSIVPGGELATEDVRAIAVGTPTAWIQLASASGGISSIDDSVTASFWRTSNTGLGSDVVRQIAIDPNDSDLRYAATDAGVFRSIDAGVTWQARSSGLASVDVFSVEVDPVTSATVYAGTDAGLFKSADSGATWALASTGLTGLEVRDILIDAGTPDTVYVAADSGIYKTTNGGANLADSSTGLTSVDIRELRFVTGSTSSLMAATGGGVFLSADSGANWAASNTGLTNTDVLSILSESATVAYAGTNGGGVFKSIDSGANWTALTGLDQGNVHALAVFGSGPATLLAGTDEGLWASSDGGTTWVSRNGGLIYTITVTNAGPSNVDGATVQDLFAQTLSCKTTCVAGSGATCSQNTISGDLSDSIDLDASASVVYTSVCAVDPGASGTVSNTATVTAPGGATDTNAANNTATDMATLVPSADLSISKTDSLTSVIPGNDITYVIEARNQGGSDAIGATITDTFDAALDCTWTCSQQVGPSFWREINAGLGNLVVEALAVDPTTTTTVYAGTAGGVFKTTNAGQSWTAMNTGLLSLDVRSLLIHPTTTSTLWAGTSGGLFESVDSGASWTRIQAGVEVRSLILDTRVAGNFYAATDQGVFLSTPGGGTRDWTSVQGDHPSTDTRQVGVDATTDPSTLWTASNVGVHQSIDGGTTWTASSTGLSSFNVTGIVADPPGGGETRATRLYATTTAGVSRSLDNGANWVLANAGLGSPTVRQLLLDTTSTSTATTPRPLYAATAGGVFQSTDTASTWSGANGGLTETDTQALAVDPMVSSVLYLGTNGGGIFRSDDGGSACTAGPVTGSISDTVDLARGSILTYQAVCSVDGSLTTDLTNTATVTAPQGITDPTLANDSATDVDTVNPTADLRITKTSNAGPIVPGSNVTYTMSVFNDGPSNVSGATVTDDFPDSAGPLVAGSCSWTCAVTGTGTCTAGNGDLNDSVNLTAGSSIVYTATCSIAADATGTLDNTASVTAPQGITDGNSENNTASDSDALVPTSDLTITKSNGATEVNPGAQVSYTITVQNNGPSNVVGASVTDTLPAALGGATWTCSGTLGGTCTAAGSSNIGDTVTLPVNATVTYVLQANVSASATGTLSNTATVATPQGWTDSNGNNNSATDSDPLVPSADLSITKTNNVTEVRPGDALTYTLVVNNAGPSDAPVVTVADTLSPLLESASWTCTASGGSSCAASGSGDINDSSASLLVSGSLTYTLSATLSSVASGDLINQATVSSATADPDSNNNSSTDTDPIVVEADLRITKSDGVDAAEVGQELTYSIVVQNLGPDPVVGAQVIDDLPDGDLVNASWTCVSAGQASCSVPAGTGDIGSVSNPVLVDLVAGSSVTFTLQATVSQSASGTLSNTATVATPGGIADPNSSNNSATDENALDGSDLRITKTDERDKAYAGFGTAYTIVVSNEGPDDTTGARVIDLLPEELEDVTWECVASEGASCVESGSNTLNTLVDLEAGSSVVFTVSGTIAVGTTGIIENRATVAPQGGVLDPDSSNNSVSDETNVVTAADLSITKEGTVGLPSIDFTVVVTNNGPIDIDAAEVEDLLPSGLESCEWVCTPDAGSTCAAGTQSGDIVDTVDLVLGESVTYDIVCSYDPLADDLTNTATVELPEGIEDPEMDNNSAAVTLSPRTLFENGFESGDSEEWSKIVPTRIFEEVALGQAWSRNWALDRLRFDQTTRRSLLGEGRTLFEVIAADRLVLARVEARVGEPGLEVRISTPNADMPPPWIAVEHGFDGRTLSLNYDGTESHLVLEGKAGSLEWPLGTRAESARIAVDNQNALLNSADYTPEEAR